MPLARGPGAGVHVSFLTGWPSGPDMTFIPRRECRGQRRVSETGGAQEESRPRGRVQGRAQGSDRPTALRFRPRWRPAAAWGRLGP